eukprot:8890032-Karenia_brevis.AAC.1
MGEVKGKQAELEERIGRMEIGGSSRGSCASDQLGHDTHSKASGRLQKPFILRLNGWRNGT